MKVVYLKLPPGQTGENLDEKMSYFLAEQSAVKVGENQISRSISNFYEISNKGVVVYVRSTQEGPIFNQPGNAEIIKQEQKKIEGTLVLLGFDEESITFGIFQSLIRTKLGDYVIKQ